MEKDKNVFDIKEEVKVQKNATKGKRGGKQDEGSGFFRRCFGRFKYNKVNVNEPTVSGGEHTILVDDDFEVIENKGNTT